MPMGARRERDAVVMAVTLDTGPAAGPDDGELADADAIRESLRQPERFAVLYDRHAAALHRYVIRPAGRRGAGCHGGPADRRGRPRGAAALDPGTRRRALAGLDLRGDRGDQ